MNPTNPKNQRSIFRVLRNRVIAGLFVALPIYITYYVIKWLYETLYKYIIGPVSDFLLSTWYPRPLDESGAPIEPDAVINPFIQYVMAPATALAFVVGILFIAGMFFKSRLHRLVNWLLHTIPGVNKIYSAVSNVFEAIQRSQSNEDKFERVVLVEFPHPGIKAPAFVTSECRDVETGQTILCVYVPTTPVPSSGYMLMMPEDSVISVDWDLQETLQAIVSGGLTVPPQVRYYTKNQAAALNLAMSKTKDGSSDAQEP